jgi:hypothetical protein
LAVAFTGAKSHLPPASTVGDLAELFAIEVHQLTGRLYS